MIGRLLPAPPAGLLVTVIVIQTAAVGLLWWQLRAAQDAAARAEAECNASHLEAALAAERTTREAVERALAQAEAARRALEARGRVAAEAAEARIVAAEARLREAERRYRDALRRPACAAWAEAPIPCPIDLP